MITGKVKLIKNLTVLKVGFPGARFLVNTIKNPEKQADVTIKSRMRSSSMVLNLFHTQI